MSKALSLPECGISWWRNNGKNKHFKFADEVSSLSTAGIPKVICGKTYSHNCNIKTAAIFFLWTSNAILSLMLVEKMKFKKRYLILTSAFISSSCCEESCLTEVMYLALFLFLMMEHNISRGGIRHSETTVACQGLFCTYIWNQSRFRLVSILSTRS